MRTNYFPNISTTGFWNHGGDMCHTCSPALSQWIIEYFKDQKDKPTYDFGCGHGQYLKKLYDAGFTKLIGYEGNPPEYKEFHNIVQQDLTVLFTVPKKGNCIFLEVAEHIPAQYEDIMLTNVTNACDDKLVMSWALPKQGGHGHINEMSNEDAIRRLTNKGFIFLPDETASARSVIVEGDLLWFKGTTLVFKKV